MAMMRRGPLAQYPVEWVLRQASATDATGSVEFHTSAPLTLYLRGGQVCHGVDGVPATGLAPSTAEGEHADEAAGRAAVVALVARALEATDGWYYLDPIGHHNDAGPWQWEAASIIRDARAHLHPPEPAAPPESVAAPEPVAAAPRPAPVRAGAPIPRPAAEPVDRPVRLAVPSGDGDVTLTAESWRVVCALVPAHTAGELRQALGWSPDRLDAALRELTAAGVLGDAPAPLAAPSPTAAPDPVPAAAPVAAPVPRAAPAAAPRSAPPTVSPAPGGRSVATAERRSALRRLISNLKPA